MTSDAKRLTFERPAGGRFEIGPVALRRILSHVQDGHEKLEAGGVMLGRYIAGTCDVIVDRVTAPMLGDQRSRTHWLRVSPRHQAAIDRAWRKSSGTCTFLGEWHTHPERVPSPSSTDERDWRRKLREDCYAEVLFFVIAGYGEIRVWEGAPSGKLVRLRRVGETAWLW